MRNYMKYILEFNNYLNKNFWAWFGDSKMVDKNGKPLVCYHGTNQSFDEFRTDVGHTHDAGFYGDGIYFTFGSKYSEDEASYYGGKILKVYLKVENPFDFSNLTNYKGASINIMGVSSMVFLYNLVKMFPELGGAVTLEKVKMVDGEGITKDVPISELIGLVDKYSKDIKVIDVESNRGEPLKSGYVISKSKVVEYDYTDGGGKKGSYLDYDDLGMWTNKISDEELEICLIMEAIWKYEGMKANYHVEGYMTRNPIITETIKKHGYDGIVQSMYGDEVVVFDPSQIKSATDNNGNFDPNSKKINESDGNRR